MILKYRDPRTGMCRLRIGRSHGPVVFILNVDPNWLCLELRTGGVLWSWSVGR